jgi:hypothetical protein
MPIKLISDQKIGFKLEMPSAKKNTVDQLFYTSLTLLSSFPIFNRGSTFPHPEKLLSVTSPIQTLTIKNNLAICDRPKS